MGKTFSRFVQIIPTSSLTESIMDHSLDYESEPVTPPSKNLKKNQTTPGAPSPKRTNASIIDPQMLIFDSPDIILPKRTYASTIDPQMLIFDSPDIILPKRTNASIIDPQMLIFDSPKSK
jgi:hypothetical protein